MPLVVESAAMDVITFNTIYQGIYRMQRRFCTLENLTKLVLSNLAIYTAEGDPVNINQLVPNVVHTIVDDNDPLDPNMKSVENKLREEQMELARRQLIQQLYVPRHPQLYKFTDDVLAPSFLEAIQNDDVDAIVREETETWVYSFDLFTDDFCQQLLEEVDHFQNYGLPVIRPNSMNNYGLILNEIGFGDFLTQLLEKHLSKLFTALFPEKYTHLDSHHSFIVQYKLQEDKELDFHYDDSEITLNVCLGKEFAGGDLYFCGHVDETLLGRSTEDEHFRYQHQRGRAVIHIGKHYHGAYPIVSGERYNIIVWYRDSRIRIE